MRSCSSDGMIHSPMESLPSKADSSPNGGTGVNEPASLPELPEVHRTGKPPGGGSVLRDERAAGDQGAAVRRDLERGRGPDARAGTAVKAFRAGPAVRLPELDALVARDGRPRAVGAELDLGAVVVAAEEQLELLAAVG